MTDRSHWPVRLRRLDGRSVNPDFQDILSALCAEGAEFMVVGAYALAAHGMPRATRDLDLWVGTHGGNPERVRRALIEFGAPVEDLSVDDLRRPDLIFQVGVAPQRIVLRVPVLSREHLIRNQRAAGQPQDLADLAWLEAERTRG